MLLLHLYVIMDSFPGLLIGPRSYSEMLVVDVYVCAEESDEIQSPTECWRIIIANQSIRILVRWKGQGGVILGNGRQLLADLSDPSFQHSLGVGGISATHISPPTIDRISMIPSKKLYDFQR